MMSGRSKKRKKSKHDDGGVQKRSSCTSTMSSSSRIKFNVGGTKYEVSESVLDRYPDSMLRKISSDVWEDGAKDKTSEEIFIDRNGQRFQYVLDFMRDSRVELPLSIPKGQLIADLDYFGIDYGDGSAIVLSASNPMDLFHSLGTYRDYFANNSTEIQERYFSVATEKLACDIANEYFSQLGRKNAEQNSSSQYSGYGSRSSKGDEKPIQFFQRAVLVVKCPRDHPVHLYTPSLLNEHLESVGLTCTSVRGTVYSYGHNYHDAVQVDVQLI